MKYANYYRKKELEYATKCLGLLEMLNGYSMALIENRRDHINFERNEILKKNKEHNYHDKGLDKTLKNKSNKLNRQKAQFYKFYKILRETSIERLGENFEMEDEIIDLFDEFFKNRMLISK